MKTKKLYQANEKWCNEQLKVEEKLNQIQAKIKKLEKDAQKLAEENANWLNKIMKDISQQVIDINHDKFIEMCVDKGVTLIDYKKRVRVDSVKLDTPMMPSEQSNWKCEYFYRYKCYIDDKLVFEY